jgi:hypothetical protein
LAQNGDYTLAGALVGSLSGGGSFQTIVNKGTISYTVHSPSQFGKSNYCKHVVEKATYPDIGLIHIAHDTAASPTRDYRFGDYPMSRVKPAYDSAKAAALAAFGVSIDGNVLPSTAQQYINDGFSKMKPDLTMVSLPNFLLDLDQAKSLFDLWSSRRSVARNVAGGWLNFNFGWRPSIGDVTNMISAITGVQRKLALWNASAGSIISRSTTVYTNSIFKSGSLVNIPTALGTTQWWGSLDQKITAHVAYRPSKIIAIDDVSTKLAALVDSLGFELNPAILWDKLPFSFVVDWFIGIGDYLNRIKLDTLELPFLLVDSFVQYKQTMTISSSTKYAADATYQAWSLPGAVGAYSYFERWPILPKANDLYTLGWKIPNLRQWSYGLALSLTR